MFLLHFLAILSSIQLSIITLNLIDLHQFWPAFKHVTYCIILHKIFHGSNAISSDDPEEEYEFQDQQYSKFMEIRKSHLVMGTSSSMNAILRWLRYGLAINKTERGKEKYEWCDDMTVLLCEDERLPIANLRQLAIKLLDETRQYMIENLAFGWDLTSVNSYTQLTDDRTNSGSGFSFLNHPPNLKLLSQGPKAITSCFATEGFKSLAKTCPRQS